MTSIFPNLYLRLFILFSISLFIRVIIVQSHWNNLKHASAASFGSASLGLLYTGKLSTNNLEINQIYHSSNSIRRLSKIL